MSSPIGYVDTPGAEALIGTRLDATGWALDARGIDRVEMRLGTQKQLARYGLPRPDVAAVIPGYPDGSACGFAFDGDFAPLAATRHQIAIVAVSNTGAEKILSVKSLLPHEARRSGEHPELRRHCEVGPVHPSRCAELQRAQ